MSRVVRGLPDVVYFGKDVSRAIQDIWLLSFYFRLPILHNFAYFMCVELGMLPEGLGLWEHVAKENVWTWERGEAVWGVDGLA
jgi:hypothetical protein